VHKLIRHTNVYYNRAMTGKLKIILVEDDISFAELLSQRLEEFGFLVEHYEDGASFLDLKPGGRLILLDLMLPNLDGFRVLEILRHRKDKTPVIVISARSSEEDVVKALELGAADYVFKPIRMKELIARINRFLVQETNDDGTTKPMVENDFLVTPEGERVQLTVTEARLIQLLIENPGQVFTREELIESISDKAENPKVIDVHIHNLKKKAPWLKERIRAIRALGYVYQP